MKRNKALGALVVLALGILSCKLTPSQPVRSRIDLYPSETPNSTQTALVVIHTTTALPTQTPELVVVSATPNALGMFCVSALVAVHLRPSPNLSGYPIMVLPNGTELVDLGGRDGDWLFVSYDNKQGWVKRTFLVEC